ncbi:hypothetical protein BHU72_01575 [Desulfuribacillus stibiiarsenatis]|uniref:Uncharacterized protein n=1 Tax=Desulfuribacillus stibiiarsenatis TaxID=1390249 RepID=A0A1E5LA80_9FIRM|nr:hypothetical protein BHU72_01575 [Desulfuribacillus stibiiarsenatis]
MKKHINILYFSWIVISLAIFSYLTIKFYPRYLENEFPLFTDLTVLIFLPSYFCLTWLAIHLMSIITKNRILNVIITFSIVGIAFVISIIGLEFNLLMNTVISLLALSIGSVHYSITFILFYLSDFNKSLNNK